MRARNKKKRRRVPSEEELAALRSVLRWARRGEAGDADAADCGGHLLPAGRRRPRVAVELHAHSTRSAGSWKVSFAAAWTRWNEAVARQRCPLLSRSFVLSPGYTPPGELRCLELRPSYTPCTCDGLMDHGCLIT